MNHGYDEMQAWWGSPRTVLAFCIAPLGYPGALSALSAFRGFPSDTLASIALFFLPVSYVGTLLVGVPAYRFLCTHGLTAFWVAPVAGSVVGAALSVAVYLGVIFSLGLNFSLGGEGIGSLRTVLGFAETGGLGGATVGILLWLIGRPDRQRRSA
jgi:hypothetical protein